MVRILVVEDEGIVAQNIKSRCEMLGYSVSGVVASGEEVLDQVEQDPPDLVLMDIRLSGSIDGVTAAMRLREKAAVPVVFLTAYVDDETIERAKLAEPYGYIVKPFSFADMRANIEIALHKYKMESQRRSGA